MFACNGRQNAAVEALECNWLIQGNRFELVVFKAGVAGDLQARAGGWGARLAAGSPQERYVRLSTHTARPQ